jgi:hypothetical protein
MPQSSSVIEKHRLSFAYRLAGHEDVSSIAQLFLIRFPWLNRRENPRGDAEKDLHMRLDDPLSITLIGHVSGALAAVLRGQLEGEGEFCIDAVCTDDHFGSISRTWLVLRIFRFMVPAIISFAEQRGASSVIFDTHLGNLASALSGVCERLDLPLTYVGSVGMSHRFQLKVT